MHSQHKIILAAILTANAAVTLVPAPSFAADMARPVYKAAPQPPALNWSGFYAGGHIGYAWGRFDHSVSSLGPDWAGPLPAFLTTQLSPDLKDGNVLGGFSLGANVQHGRTVWGLEADISWTGLKGSQQSAQFNPASTMTRHFFSAETKVDWLVTLRPRVGWLINDQFLAYMTGGLAVGDVKSNSTMIMRTNGGIAAPDAVFAGDVSKTSTGWTFGGGVEYALSAQWTLKAEYLHVDLGKEQLLNTRPGFPDHWQNISVKTTLDIVRIGANYRF